MRRPPPSEPPDSDLARARQSVVAALARGVRPVFPVLPAALDADNDVVSRDSNLTATEACHALAIVSLDSLRVIEEAGIDPPSYATLKRRLRAFAEQS